MVVLRTVVLSWTKVLLIHYSSDVRAAAIALLPMLSLGRNLVFSAIFWLSHNAKSHDLRDFLRTY